MSEIKILANGRELAKTAAERFIETITQAISVKNVARVVLAGGSTPQVLYNLLASDTYRDRVPWERVHIFFGDERCVPPDHPESNFLKANYNLLSRVPLLPENIYRIPAELEPERAAGVYEETLLAYFSSQLDPAVRAAASFDLVLLGMGEDGHTASLFPGTPAIHETTRWVAAQYVDELAAWRITLTPAILNRAGQILFLVSGENKSYALQRVLYGAFQPDRYPAQVIQPGDEHLTWLVDEAAAALF